MESFEFLKIVFPKLFTLVTRNKMADKIEVFINSLRNLSPAVLVSYYKARMQRPDRCNVLKTSNVPAVFNFGEFYIAVPLKVGLELCQLPEKSYIHILYKSGHMRIHEETWGNCRVNRYIFDRNLI